MRPIGRIVFILIEQRKLYRGLMTLSGMFKNLGVVHVRADSGPSAVRER